MAYFLHERTLFFGRRDKQKQLAKDTWELIPDYITYLPLGSGCVVNNSSGCVVFAREEDIYEWRMFDQRKRILQELHFPCHEDYCLHGRNDAQFRKKAVSPLKFSKISDYLTTFINREKSCEYCICYHISWSSWNIVSARLIIVNWLISKRSSNLPFKLHYIDAGGGLRVDTPPSNWDLPISAIIFNSLHPGKQISPFPL